MIEATPSVAGGLTVMVPVVVTFPPKLAVPPLEMSRLVKGVEAPTVELKATLAPAPPARVRA